MTDVLSCPDCGGTHFGSSKCPIKYPPPPPNLKAQVQRLEREREQIKRQHEQEFAKLGLVIVPIEPTWLMVQAGRDQDYANEKETIRRIEEEDTLTWRTEEVRKVWSAMIKAAQ